MPARARLGLLSLLVLVAAACGTAAAPTQALVTAGVTPTPAATPTAVQATATRAASSDTPAPATKTPGATSTPAASSDADACSASADNKSFFAAAAREFKWAVYCAVLPAGWYVDQGQFVVDAGGQLTISYKGPGGVSLELKEGTYCSDGESVCQPKVQEVGPTLFGDQMGTLYTLEPGYAVYVNAGTSPPSWAAASVTLDETTFVKLVAGLHKVVP
jgi:hypothetical protein